MAGRLIAPFEDKPLTAAEVEALSLPSVKQIYAVVANPDIRIAQADAVELAGTGTLFDLSGNRVSRAELEEPSALGMVVQVLSTGPTSARLTRPDPLVVQELTPPIGYMRSETVYDPSVLEPDRLPLNGYEVVTFSVDDLDIPFDLQPGYVVTEDWAVLGTTLSSLEQFHKAASGSVESLRNVPQFKNLVETLPEPCTSLLTRTSPPWRLWSKKRCRKILDLITGKRLSLS